MLTAPGDGRAAVVGWFVDKVSGPLVTGAVVAVVGGWWLSRLNERYKSERELYSRAAEGLREDLKSLVKTAACYWSSPYKSDTSPAAEAELTLLLAQIDEQAQICSGVLWDSQDADAPRLVGEVMSAVYGASFGLSSRVADVSRITRIVTAASKLSAHVAQSRQMYVAGAHDRSRRRRFWYRIRVMALTWLACAALGADWPL